MKRIITILFLTLILGLGAVQLIYQDEINLFEFVKQKLIRRAERIISKPAPIRYVTEVAPLDTVHNGTFPAWQNQPTKQRRLVLQYQIPGQNEHNRFQFREVIDLEFDSQGNLYALDFGNKSIEAFDSAGQHVRTLGVGKDRKRFMFKPTDLELHLEGQVYVSDRRKGIL
ncbi:hypothetical protein GWO43_14030, partial [candidate division KSB1 bacterium]|nr:hypothetical protein [candidate division KSB1 bacterium]NIR72336.1 hypothetical protein [candidate division KSB1 bacterium]NIS25042.1 hypothetical protein [candidate division KSB1 bacterium]NIT71963.1 hypothetical protein [candidate division KSB1 bacterium]NIU25719.1 hypothetical protein [candidate division KSB1 bacterium]